MENDEKIILENETDRLQLNQILESDLTVVDYIETMPFVGSNGAEEPAPNLNSPVSIGNKLYFIDQNGAIYRANNSNNPQIQQIFNVSKAPNELTLNGRESILNITIGSDPNSIYVMFTSKTEPTTNIPIYYLPDPLPGVVGLEQEAVSFLDPPEVRYHTKSDYQSTRKI